MVRHPESGRCGPEHLEKAPFASENNLWAFLLRVQLENEPNKKRWLGNDRQEVELILDELLYRFEQGWENQSVSLDPLTQRLKNLYFLLRIPENNWR